MHTLCSRHVSYTLSRVWVTEAMFTNHSREFAQNSLAKSTLLKYAQRKPNLFSRISLCLPSPTRAEYATIRQPNYNFRAWTSWGHKITPTNILKKSLWESTTEYSNVHKCLKLEFLVRITKIITRLYHTKKYNMHTSASSHVFYTFARVWGRKVWITNHTRECSKTTLAKLTLLKKA